MQNRRSVLASAGLAALPLPSALNSAVKGSPQAWAVDHLQVNGLNDPMGLEDERPKLSWQVSSARRATRQMAYRIGVASSRDAATAGRFDVWDSGRIENSHTFDVAYEGPALGSRRRVWWRVTAWDDRGTVAHSALAQWEMGLLRPSDWKGVWLAAETRLQRDDRQIGLAWRQDAAPRADSARGFRFTFTLPEPAEVIVMTACDAFADIYVDGRHLVAPARNGWGVPGPWSKQLPLSVGKHVVAIETADGGDTPRRAAAFVRAQLTGERILRFEGSAMRTASAPPQGWREIEFDDSGWAATAASGGRSPMPAGSALLMRRPFSVRGKIASARLYMTALGLFEAELNGGRVGDALLRPEFTDYRAHCLYCIEDVTEKLVQGDNVLGLHVGDGWYGSYISPNGRFSFGPEPLRAMGQLEIRYADGRHQTIATDDQWLISPSPITQATIYGGEHYDARLEQRGWSTAFFRPNSTWEKVAATDPARGTLVAAIAPPIRRKDWLKPRAVSALANGASVVDFGQNFTGWARLRVRGPSGLTVKMRYAELLNADGSVDQTNLRQAEATDVYTLRGDPSGEVYEPRFTYHGFRYVQVEGLGARLSPDAITGIHVRSDLAETSELSIEAHVPQRLWINSRWSQRSNFVGIPTDCPQRDERLGWTGDAHVFWDAACFNMDTLAFTQRFMRDMRDAQRSAGDFPDIAPNANHEGFTPPGSSPGWGDAGVALPWTVAMRYGDTAIIDQNWAAMTRFVESIRANNPDLTWENARGSDYGDWLALDAVQPGDPTTPKDLVGTAMWKGAVDQLADMARWTGRSADATRYRHMGADLGRAFQRNFVKANGRVGNGSQTGYILALHFGLLEESQRAGAAAQLVADIRRRGTLLSTGFLGTPYSLDVLADAGETRLAYDLLLRTEFPSWGYMIAKGATTTWERWNSDAGDRSMNSFNHYALGAVVGFIFRRIAAITPLAPGFSEFAVDPLLDRRVPAGGATYEAKVGRIATRWRQQAGGLFEIDLNVPANASARLSLPTLSPDRVREAGRKPGSQIKILDQARDRVTLQVPSGSYRFSTY